MPSAVLAAGLAAEQLGTVLGQPLNFPVQVRLDPGESLSAECVNAEVYVSDQRLPPSAVRTQIDQQGSGLARVRVQTQQAIDEPVLSITLRVGCAAPITRRFVVFADPPLMATPAATAAAALPLVAAASVAAPAAATAAAAAATPAAVSPGAEPATLEAPRQATTVRAAGAAGTPAASTARAVERPANRVARPSSATGADDRPRPAQPAPRTPVRAPTEKAPATVTAAAPVAAAPAPGPRLSLEPLAPLAVKPTQAASPSVSARSEAETDAVSQAMQVVAQAASAARAAALAASASADRMASLERTVAQMRSESQANQALIAELRQRLDQTPGANPWLWPLLLVAAALAVLSAWLSWRLGRAQTLRQQAWVQQRQASMVSGVHTTGQGLDTTADKMSRARTGPAPFVTTDVPTFPPRSSLASAQAPAAASRPMAPLPSARGGAAAATAGAAGAAVAAAQQDQAVAPDSLSVDSPMARTEPMPAPLRGGNEGVRDVSIEELIDLEQQAEFFVVLGQDEAAIDLLVDHLRSTGGGSPLPYLKLLEIYSRTNDRSAYERNRARFNHRFNAYAPEWGSDLAHGRTLEDYPGILPRLEQVWPRPLDAMAELEALLFRKSRGELFELPAYREVLFLYALARDLLDHGAVDTGTVDLLLPLSDGSTFGTTAPIPFLHDEAHRGDSSYDPDDPPTRPVDFDLTIPAQQTSMFDPMDDDAPHLAPLRRR